MNGTLAQQIALTTYGNAFLCGAADVDWAAFFPANNTFSFCEFVRFVDRGGGEAGPEPPPYAPDPVAWFARLGRDGASHVRLVCGIPPGGSVPRWFNEAVTPQGADIWDARWELGDRDRQDRKIWRVTYSRTAADVPQAPLPPIDRADLEDRFSASLRASADLAHRHGMEWFVKAFEAGRAALEGRATGLDGYDLSPSSILPSEARRLLAAVQAAWVFGGMGSWNDVSFEGEDQAIYQTTARELYQALNEAVIVAVNASAPSGA